MFIDVRVFVMANVSMIDDDRTDAMSKVILRFCELYVCQCVQYLEAVPKWVWHPKRFAFVADKQNCGHNNLDK